MVTAACLFALAFCAASEGSVSGEIAEQNLPRCFVLVPDKAKPEEKAAEGVLFVIRFHQKTQLLQKFGSEQRVTKAIKELTDQRDLVKRMASHLESRQKLLLPGDAERKVAIAQILQADRRSCSIYSVTEARSRTMRATKCASHCASSCMMSCTRTTLAQRCETRIRRLLASSKTPTITRFFALQAPKRLLHRR